jgi:hypothetical protein
LDPAERDRPRERREKRTAAHAEPPPGHSVVGDGGIVGDGDYSPGTVYRPGQVDPRSASDCSWTYRTSGSYGIEGCKNWLLSGGAPR